MVRAYRVLAVGFVSCVLGGMMSNAESAGVADERFEIPTHSVGNPRLEVPIVGHGKTP